MARPLPTRKKPVNLASPGPRVSRIRRDPPPPVKEKVIKNPDERDRWDAAVGIVVFALAIFVILLGFSAYTGHSPREYILRL